ncbi:hypothetical protein [Sulfurimonas sp.]|uniref:hypothetical protein n=1 Tax=Sulfurimonas sp. TaxID=2022749 RepID=UPI0025F37F59|nr:hypothetical protein [Sulfurimonas sp.]MBW6489465.1 hypothetical protein [Sulfurimonas sp.]
MKYILSSLLFASLIQIFLWLNSSDKSVLPPNAENRIESFAYNGLSGHLCRFHSDS